MRNQNRTGFTLVELMVVIAILGLLASVLATAVIPKMRKAKHDLDKKTLQDLYNELQIVVASDEDARRKLNSPAMADKRGHAFWEACFKRKILGREVLVKLISAGGIDHRSDSQWIRDPQGFLPIESCSFTAPKGSEVTLLMGLHGYSRRIMTCLNSRNWNNYEDEVLVMWSDGLTATYFDLEEAQFASADYQITEEQWLNPGAELFGQVIPFDGVWD